MKLATLFLLMFLSSTAFCGNEEAFEAAKVKAEQGDATAQWALGACYYSGDGVLKDPKKAEYWYTKSAEQGNDKAQYNLGICYYLGDGILKDHKKAV